jgi:nucleoside-triphosphatase THEP1
MEIIKIRNTDQRWLRAAVIASYWAAFEIIVGSFLHNLRIPMSGTILSFSSVVLVVSFISKWKMKGIIWRAGIICALLKSISPSAVILGPMIGIASEAILLELFISLFGFNFIGYLVGGIFAVQSALIHKVVSLLILYGFDLVKILSALYKYSAKQFGFIHVSAERLILLIILIYTFTGALAAFIGYLAGKRSLGIKILEPKDERSILENGKQLFAKVRDKGYSIGLLLLNVVLILSLLIYFSYGLNAINVMLASGYLVFVGFRYKNALKRLLKPGLWIQFILISILASLLLGSVSNNSVFSFEGLKVGLSMIFRALIVVMGFSAISSELRNPLIRAVSLQHGYSGLYQSVNLAFSALPAVIREFPGTMVFLKKPLSTFAEIIPRSETFIQAFDESIAKRPNVIIISGERQGGKTTFVKDLLKKLQARRIQCAGFLAIGVHQEGKRIGFDLLDFRESNVFELCRLSQNNALVSFQRFEFNHETMAKGMEILQPEKIGKAEVVVIDEVGPIELKNEGWSESIRLLCEHPEYLQIWIVRQPLVRQVAASWQVGDVYVFDILKDKDEDVIKKINELLSHPLD